MTKKFTKMTKDEIKRLKGDKIAITAIVFLAVAIVTVFAVELMYNLPFTGEWGFSKTILQFLFNWLLYTAGQFAFLVFLEDGYKTKYQKKFFAVSMIVAVIDRVAIVAINAGLIMDGFSQGVASAMFSVENVAPLLLYITALVSVMTGKHVNVVKAVGIAVAAVSLVNIVVHTAFCVIYIRTLGMYISVLFEALAYFTVIPKVASFDEKTLLQNAE